MTLLSATTPGQSVPERDGNEGVLCIPQSSWITGTSTADCLVSYQGHSLGQSYPSAEKQSIYSTAQADWTTRPLDCIQCQHRADTGQPTLVCPCIGVHLRTSLTSSSLLIQQKLHEINFQHNLLSPCPDFIDWFGMIFFMAKQPLWAI